MNFKFKKPPFYFYIILWIISLALGLQLDKKIQNLSDLFGLVVLIMPIAFAYIWVLKNKIKIFNYYKKIRKKFRHVFYTTESIVCVLIISLIISLISFGGYKNLKEKLLFEYIVWIDKYDECNSDFFAYRGYGEFSRYFFKANTQFLDYFEFKPYQFVKDVYELKDEKLFNFDHCKASRILLKEAHKGNQVARDMLAAYSPSLHAFYQINDDYLFWRYLKLRDKKKLYNPALEYAQIFNEASSIDERIKKTKEISEQGYLLAMEDYLIDVTKNFDIKKNEDQCPFILKFNNYLHQEGYIIGSAVHIFASMGRTFTNHYKAEYECSGKKIDFKKSILLMKEFFSKIRKPRPSNNFITTYPAMIYFNGWGNVYKDQELAIKLFKKNLEGSASAISKAYLTLNNLNNGKNDLKLFYEILDSAPTTYSQEKKYIICNNTKYDFKLSEVENETSQQYKSRKLKFLEPIKTCLDNASRDQRIISVKSYIKSWIEYWFKNPELVKTLNLYG